MMGLTAADPGVNEHLLLSEMFKNAIVHDQLNVTDLALGEMLSRRLQL